MGAWLAEFAWGGGVDLAHGGVEGAEAGESGGGGDVDEGEVGDLKERACGLRSARPGQGERAGAGAVDQESLDLAGGVAQPGGQARHTLAVDDAVVDEPHGAGDGVGSEVPVRGTGRAAGEAAFAGAEAGGLGCGGAGVEGDVLVGGGAGRATRAAVDAGGEHAGEEATVEARILGADGAQAGVAVGMHASSVRHRRVGYSQESDIAADVSDRGGQLSGRPVGHRPRRSGAIPRRRTEGGFSRAPAPPTRLGHLRKRRFWPIRPTCRIVTFRPSARGSTDRAADYGSAGWGFESLRARQGLRPRSSDRGLSHSRALFACCAGPRSINRSYSA